MVRKSCLLLTLYSTAVVTVTCLLEGAFSEFLKTHLSQHCMLYRLGLPKTSSTTTTLGLEMMVPRSSMVSLRLRLSGDDLGDPSLG